MKYLVVVIQKINSSVLLSCLGYAVGAYSSTSLILDSFMLGLWGGGGGGGGDQKKVLYNCYYMMQFVIRETSGPAVPSENVSKDRFLIHVFSTDQK